jgi:hypothetical protein
VAQKDGLVSNRDDFDNLANELVEMFHLYPDLEFPNTGKLRERLEAELHNAHVAGQESIFRLLPSNMLAAVEQVLKNLELSARQKREGAKRDARLGELRRRAEAVGASISGQDGDEGVFDAAGRHHEPYSLVDGVVEDDEEMDALERVIERLEYEARR